MNLQGVGHNVRCKRKFLVYTEIYGHTKTPIEKYISTQFFNDTQLHMGKIVDSSIETCPDYDNMFFNNMI